MKRKLLSFILFLALPFFIKAAEPGSLSGKVTEVRDFSPIPAAVVTLLKADLPQQVFQTTSTDDQGAFRFDGLKPGTYHIRVSYVGFTTVERNNIILSPQQLHINLGRISLAEDQQHLAEVNITAEKPAIEFGADMITYNVGQSLLAEGSTATDLLKNVPMVQVDIDGNTTIAGKRSTRVFIDGKPSDYMTSNIADLLNVLPSDAIEKIEVMTNPPVKYSADGEGIINIVMKKGFKIGFNGNVGLTKGIQGNTNANTNASYRGKNYAINGSASYQHREMLSRSLSLRKNFTADTTFYYDQRSENSSDLNGGNFKAGLDWDISSRQNLRLSTSFNRNNSEGNSGIELNYLDEMRKLSRIRMQQNDNNGSNQNFVINADYEMKIDSAQKVSFGATYNRHHNTSFRSLDRYISYPKYGAPILQENDNQISSQGLSINIDYDKTIRKAHTIELGFSYNFRENDNALLVHNFDFEEQIFRPNQQLTNQFIYDEHILSGYGSYRYKHKGWTMKSGFRTELTSVAFDLSGGERNELKPYLSVFPNLSLSRFFNNRYTIGASYSIRINRPRENSLNPQVNNTDPLNIFFGNPDLQPAYTHQLELSFGVFGERWSFTPRLSYSSSDAVIERFRTVDSSGVSTTTYDNVGNNKSLAATLIGNFRPTKKITTHATLSFVQGQYTSVLNNRLNRNGMSIRSTVGISMQLPFKTAFETNLNYANQLNAQGRTRASVSNSIAARKLFFKNRLNIRVSGNDPFGKRRNILFNEGSNFILNNESTNNTNNVSVSVNYRFTKVRKSV